jgi:hypothetical protein
MDDCSSIDMQMYWNYVGTPLFLLIVGFGIFVLMSLSSFQLIPEDAIRRRVSSITSSLKEAAKQPQK